MIRIIDYLPQHQADFRRINVAWISEAHMIEDVDLEVLDHPEASLVLPGGCIIVAVESEQVVGTCALLKSGNGMYQMTKMGVDEAHRGKGTGRLLGEAIIVKARELGARKVMLYSNRTSSAIAIELYRRLGFEERPMPMQEYARANIYMELDLN